MPRRHPLLPENPSSYEVDFIDQVHSYFAGKTSEIGNMAPFTGICKDAEYVPYIVKDDVIVKGFLKVVKTECPSEWAIRAYICLVNLAIYEVSAPVILRNGGLEIALANLHLLDESDTDSIDCGLSSAFLIARTVGKDETGPGPNAISGNPRLVEKLEWILSEVLEAGEGYTVIGAHWDPANIMLDVATLATSDMNKPLLGNFIGLIARALKERGGNNKRLRQYSVQALSQLVFSSKHEATFQEYKQDITNELEKIEKIDKDDRDLSQSAAVLRQTLADLGKAKPNQDGLKMEGLKPMALKSSKRPSAPPKKLDKKAPSMRQKIFGGGKGKLQEEDDEEAAASSGDEGPEVVIPSTGHVMISYQWDCQPIAKALEKKLSSAGMRTWFDLNDMGTEINSSMVYAVENAWCVVVLFSKKYKESGNCRKECEMADYYNKHLVFVKVEEDYQQEAWLALIMGNKLWIKCCAEEQVDEAFPQLKKKVVASGREVLGLGDAETGHDNTERGAKFVQPGKEEIFELKEDVTEMKEQVENLKRMVKIMQEEITKLRTTSEQQEAEIKLLKG